MNYRLGVLPGSSGGKLLKLLEEMLAPKPEARALRGQLLPMLKAKPGSRCAKRLESSQKMSLQGFPDP